MKNLLQRKNEIRNSKEAYKRPKEKNRQGSPVFTTYTELWRCWEIEISRKSWSSNKLELIIEKLKQTANMNRLHLMKKGNIEKLEKTWEDNEHKLSSYFITKCSCANLLSCVSFFSLCLIQQRGAFSLSFWKIILFF